MLSVGAESANAKGFRAVDVVGLDLLVVSVVFVEPKSVLVDVP